MAKFKKYDDVTCVKTIDNLIVKVRVGANGYVDRVRDDDSYVVKFGFWEVGCNDSHLELTNSR